ncbi:MAG TPA: hypothetical protein VGM16_03675 [Gammaproteobacteria bacterium]|jgi:hypothetical protein
MDQQRSTFVTVVGWIFIVISGLGTLYCLIFMFTPTDKLLAQFQQQQAAMPAGSPAADPQMMVSMMRGMFFFFFVVELWVLLSSIGLVLRKGWARISFIVVMAFGIFVSLIYVLIGLAGRSAPMGQVPGSTPEMAGFMHAIMGVMAILGAVFAALFVFIIYKLNTAKVKAEFVPQPKP